MGTYNNHGVGFRVQGWGGSGFRFQVFAFRVKMFGSHFGSVCKAL